MNALPADAWRLAPMHEMHLPEVLDIEVRAYAFPWTESILRDCLRAGYSAWILQGADGRILAYALMTMAVGEAHILNLAVDPVRRREGMARHLLRHLLLTARAAHMTIVLLEVRRSNKAALRLYHDHGFRQIGTRRNYYPGHEQREDAFVLALDLE